MDASHTEISPNKRVVTPPAPMVAKDNERPGSLKAGVPGRVVALTNIPTPYRVHFYDRLHQTLSARGGRLEVLFMGTTEPNRQWKIDPATLPFEASVASGVRPLVRSQPLYLNPGLLRSLWQSRPDVLLCSGGWFQPTLQAALLVARRRGIRTVFWNESNLAFSSRMDGPVARWRAATFRRFDAFAVPGQWARTYVEQLVGPDASPPFIPLPNIVDERLFDQNVSRLRQTKIAELRARWSIRDEDGPVLLSVARLESSKGIDRLVGAVASLTGSSQFTLLIAGTGTLRDQLESSVATMAAPARVRLLGSRSQSDILELLAIADGFVLPSIRDPYPLSVVEAMFAGLPLLLSNRVGCHPETLIQGETGWLFDPTEPTSIQSALHGWLSAGSAVRLARGTQARQVARSIFDSDRVVADLVAALAQL